MSDELVLTPAERAFAQALADAGVRYLLVGMGAALLEGAQGITQDLDFWVGEMDPEKLSAAAKRAGGYYTSGFGLQAPAVGGEGLERVDLVMAASGLDSFEQEYARSREYVIDGLPMRVLPLERVIANKRAAGRPKDIAHLPLLEAALAARSLPKPEPRDE